MPPFRPLAQRAWGVLHRPEYIFRPVQLYRRLRKRHLIANDAVMLAWGLPVTADPDRFIGTDIVNLGVFDRVVPEAILRLLNGGEIAVDVGANIGQNTSMMAVAAGRRGAVHAVEPHPGLLPVLQRNVERWRSFDLAAMTVHPLALGAAIGTATLHEPADFERNSGSGSLLAERAGDHAHAVTVETLDHLIAAPASIGVLKLDVEGYELEVLRGAESLLTRGAIRDILFEDYEVQPSAVRQFLAARGYSVFALTTPFSGPALTPVERSAGGPLHANFLATLEPARARARFAARGWRCLRRGAFTSGGSMP